MRSPQLQRPQLKDIGRQSEDLQAVLLALGEADLILLVLFSDKVMIGEKTKMIEKLAIEKDLDNKRWTTVPQDPSSVTLSDLVTKESLFSFTALNLDTSFLQSPVLNWKENKVHNHGKQTIHHLAVTNDATEWGDQTDH
ncbi:hypothetical protein E2C01_057499 [Portunus trituberculatus]|uniref:Uncharacterized protein n=1 Tax=Portunus trituberculatus TaxID=210409 RepID=A0A5B7GT18_PORTR|nr:hypothetical protein [Portunus trituberculatus]